VQLQAGSGAPGSTALPALTFDGDVEEERSGPIDAVFHIDSITVQ